MTQPNPYPPTFIGVKMPPALAVALKTTAEQRGTTVSDVIRTACALHVAQLPQKAQ